MTEIQKYNQQDAEREEYAAKGLAIAANDELMGFFLEGEEDEELKEVIRDSMDGLYYPVSHSELTEEMTEFRDSIIENRDTMEKLSSLDAFEDPIIVGNPEYFTRLLDFGNAYYTFSLELRSPELRTIRMGVLSIFNQQCEAFFENVGERIVTSEEILQLCDQISTSIRKNPELSNALLNHPSIDASIRSLTTNKILLINEQLVADQTKGE